MFQEALNQVQDIGHVSIGLGIREEWDSEDILRWKSFIPVVRDKRIL